MKNPSPFSFALLLLLLLPLCSQAQKDYFQQEVNYTINVRLDNARHMLQGNIEIEYTNRAPEALDRIYMHLWPNAYKNNETEFAKAQFRTGGWKYYNAHDSIRGFIDSLDFKVNGQNVRWELLQDTIDVAVLWLEKPLATGAKLKISTPFRVKVPGNFSRLGYSREQYQLCQWYPKPAVYDNDGWHYMPYLDMGEFYSEFGDFEVFISVPENFQVAASGNLQTASEQRYLDSLSAHAYTLDTFPPISISKSSDRYKTLHYKLEQAHDFAWFCGKNYYVKQSEIKLPHSGRTVKTAVFFSRETKFWKDAVAYVDSSVYYYSLWLGDYPYDVCTAVDGALTAGGGMEYPTITVIAGAGSASSLDLVIAHEVGHNWFYGILASNERDHPFMDEGFNSYYEARYMKKRYPHSNPEMSAVLGGLDLGLGELNLDHFAYLFSKRRGKDASLWHSHSTDYDMETYGTLVYKRTALEVKYLEGYLGTEEFDRVMKHYYETWKLRHPSPADMEGALKEAGPTKSIDWWFDQRLRSTGKVDVRISSVKKLGDNSYRVTVANKGVDAPFSLAAINDSGTVITEQWHEAITGKKKIDMSAGEPISAFEIDPNGSIPLYRRGLSKANAPSIMPWVPSAKPFLGLATSNNRMYISPIMALNAADGYMLGLGLFSPIMLPQDFEYAILPMYAFGSNRVVGQAMLRYNWHPLSGAFSRIQLGGSVAQYENYEQLQGVFAKPVMRLRSTAQLREPLSSIKKHGLTLELSRVSWNLDFSGNLPAYVESDLYLGSIFYEAKYKKLRSPWSWKAGIESGKLSAYDGVNTRLSAEVKQRWYYKTNGKRGHIDHRLFAGYALVNQDFNPVGFITQGAVSGPQDYRFDEVFYSRGAASSTFWNNQVIYRDAGMRSVMNASALAQLQASPASWMAAYNFAFKVPKFPFELYGNAAITDQVGKVELMYVQVAGDPVTQIETAGIFAEAGVALTLFDGFIKLNYNALQSFALKPNFDVTGRKPEWYEFLSWSIDLNKLNPYNLVRDL